MADGTKLDTLYWSIYILRDVDDPSIGYVGQTSQDPAKRLRSHMSHNKATNGRLSSIAKRDWFDGCRARGVVPVIEVVTTCYTAEEANEAERRWIATAREHLGLCLVNSTEGGQGVYPFDFGERISAAFQRPESRKRKAVATRAQMQKQWADPVFKEAMRAKLRAAWQRPERIEKNKAAWRDTEKRALRIASLTVAHRRPEYRKAASLRGRTLSVDARQRIAEASRLRWADPVFRAATSAKLRKYATKDEARAVRNATSREKRRRERAERVSPGGLSGG